MCPPQDSSGRQTVGVYSCQQLISLLTVSQKRQGYQGDHERALALLSQQGREWVLDLWNWIQLDRGCSTGTEIGLSSVISDPWTICLYFSPGSYHRGTGRTRDVDWDTDPKYLGTVLGEVGEIWGLIAGVERFWNWGNVLHIGRMHGVQLDIVLLLDPELELCIPSPWDLSSYQGNTSVGVLWSAVRLLTVTLVSVFFHSDIVHPTYCLLYECLSEFYV